MMQWYRWKNNMTFSRGQFEFSGDKTVVTTTAIQYSAIRHLHTSAVCR